MIFVYLLKIDNLIENSDNEKAISRVDGLLDDNRLAALKRMSNNPKGAAMARGAGILLQYAATCILKGELDFASDECQCPVKELSVKELSITELLAYVKERINMSYKKGPSDKPYWTDERLPYFNISHSGDYVAIAISKSEVGIDLQKSVSTGKIPDKEIDMAKRFFSEHESELVSMDKQMFYKLWARKEALGKCDGIGVRPYLDKDLSDFSRGIGAGYQWYEQTMDEYSLCVCVAKDSV